MGKKKRNRSGQTKKKLGTTPIHQGGVGAITPRDPAPWSYLIPAAIFVIMVWDSGDFFARVNIYKTFLLFVSVSLLFLFVDLLLRLRNQQRGIEVVSPPMGWLLFLSLPFIATLPGLLLHGGGYNYLLEHELSIHLMFMMWLTYLIRCVKNMDALEKLMMVVGLTILYVVVEGAAQGVARPKSTFGNTNLYANYLILFLPLLLLLWLPLNLEQSKARLLQWQKMDAKQYYFLLIFLVGLFGLWQTQTRAAVAGFAGAIILLFLYLLYLRLKQRYQLRGWVFMVAAFGVPLLLLLLFLFTVSQLSEETIQANRFLSLGTWEAWSSRFMPWQVAISSVADSPLFGYGPGSSYNLFFEYLPADSRLYTTERSFKHAHSEILEVMQEGGIFGLLVHLLVLVGLFWIIVRMLQSDSLDNREKRMVMGIGLGIVAYNVHSIFSLATRMTQNEMTLYGVIAMLLVLYPKAALQGRFAEGLQRPLSREIPAQWTFLVVILFCWGIQYPTFQGSNELATLARTKVKTVKDVKALTEQYQNSPSVYVLHFLANLQVGAKQGGEMNLLLDRMESMIAHYRDADYLRFMAYQLNSGSKPDINKLKALAQSYHDRDHYDARTLLWIARIAAFEKDQKTFLQQIRYAAHLHALKTQQLTISEVARLQVVVGDFNKGSEIHFGQGELEVRLSQQLIDQMMADARRVVDAKQQSTLLKRYMSEYRAVVPNGDSSDSMKQKQEKFSKNLYKQLTTWSALP